MGQSSSSALNTVVICFDKNMPWRNASNKFDGSVLKLGYSSQFNVNVKKIYYHNDLDKIGADRFYNIDLIVIYTASGPDLRSYDLAIKNFKNPIILFPYSYFKVIGITQNNLMLETKNKIYRLNPDKQAIQDEFELRDRLEDIMKAKMV